MPPSLIYTLPAEPLVRHFRLAPNSKTGLLERFPRPRSDLDNPTFKKPSTANKARVYDAVHTRIVTQPFITKKVAFQDSTHYVSFPNTHQPWEFSMYRFFNTDMQLPIDLLLDDNMKSKGIYERHYDDYTTERRRCLSDGTNWLWVYLDAGSNNNCIAGER